MRLTEHPLWPLIRPYIRIETYDRDGGHAHPRHRIEIDAPPDSDAVLLAVEVHCVCCRRPIHPIRQRNGGRKGLYVAVTCDLGRTLGCARSVAARHEYERIVGLMSPPLLV